MIFPILVLITAICLSLVSGYYSIVGLTAIFAAAFWPIVIMGGTLEVAKIMSTLWLHYNWERAEWKIKSYLVAAVCVLMLITSMGTFGFLSKAHLDQTVPSGDIQAQVSLFDEKIKIERDNIANDRTLIKQLDDVVNNKNAEAPRELTRKDGTKYTEDTAERALAIRRSQSKDRTNLTNDIEKAQKNIVALQAQRAPIASQARKADADVGPIRYIAALIYGDNPDQNTLESAVRLVIIIIVLVQDPLAIVLLLASTTSIDWEEVERKKRKKEEIQETKTEPKSDLPKEDIQPVTFDTERAALVAAHQLELDGAVAEERKKYNALLLNVADQNAAEEELAEATASLRKITEDFNALVPTMIALEEECAGLVSQDSDLRTQLATLIESYDILLDEKIALDETVKQLGEESSLAKEYAEQLDTLRQELSEKNAKIESTTIELGQLHGRIEEKNNELLEVKKEFMGDNALLQQEISNKEVTIKDLYTALQREVDENNLLRNAKVKEPSPTPEPIPEPPVVIPVIEAPALVATADDKLPLGGNASFGVTFPLRPINGDLFLRVDYMPSKLFKWVGSRWVEIDKSITSAYAFDEKYVKLLVEKVSSGEYDIDDLNQTEQEQVAQYLRNHPK